MQLKKFFLARSLMFISACATVEPTFKLPLQGADVTPPVGQTRVTFFNDTNKLLYPTTGLIGIAINGEGVANINHQQYIQVDLDPGVYELTL